MAKVIARKYSEQATELVDINRMRTEKQTLRFWKMEGSGDDYILFDNMDSSIPCPEAMAVTYCNRHYGIGGDGIALIERSAVADAKMRIFNADGTEGKMAGNCIRCAAKFLYDSGLVRKEEITVETGSGIRALHLFTMDGKVTSVSVEMGKANFDPASLPTTLKGERIIDRKIWIGDQDYDVTCLSVGNPHCVVLRKNVDALDLQKLGPLFENDPIFPERVNTEFVRIVNGNTLKMRVWERGNGETLACGTGACAAVAAATELGYFEKGQDITVKLPGGDLIVNYTDDGITLSGGVSLIYEGTANTEGYPVEGIDFLTA